MLVTRLVIPLVLLAGCGRCSSEGSGPIARGTPSWVRTHPEEPLLDARVDVGTLHSVGDREIEVVIEFPSAPGTLATMRSMHPELQLPDGAFTRERERIACTPEGEIDSTIEIVYLASDGHEIARETPPLRKSTGTRPGAYGDNPRALACLAAASKCRDEPLVWPPPPNTTPLNDAPASKAQRAAYAARFVPTCAV
jgi:hypothetical protein